MYKPTFTTDGIQPNVLHADFVVSGAVQQRAMDIEEEMKQGVKYPFSKIIYCNIGNPHVLGQQPLTFFREILSLLTNPALLDHPNVYKLYTPDVIERARYMLKETPGGVGAYSHSQGLPFIRKDVAAFIEKRDGFPCSFNTIFLSQGASPGIQTFLQFLIRSSKDGIMIPYPQYPLYSVTITMYGGTEVPYSLDESKGWLLTKNLLEKSLSDAKKKDIDVRALVIINPGNPTGSSLPESCVLEVLDFAYHNSLALLVDEVYQTNIYKKQQKPFVSFRKTMLSNGDRYKGLELISFHSISKGFVGECGLRGGYFQMENIDPKIRAELYKLASLSLCPNVMGQMLVDLMVKPPEEGSASYAKYKQEQEGLIASLGRRAKLLSQELNKLPRCSCVEVEGALYAFPKIELQKSAVEEAQRRGIKPDAMYAMSLLESEGICTEAGSGFGQEEGTYHIRTTILPQEADMAEVCERFKRHHLKFIETHFDKAIK